MFEGKSSPEAAVPASFEVCFSGFNLERHAPRQTHVRLGLKVCQPITARMVVKLVYCTFAQAIENGKRMERAKGIEPSFLVWWFIVV